MISSAISTSTILMMNSIAPISDIKIPFAFRLLSALIFSAVLMFMFGRPFILLVIKKIRKKNGNTVSD